ncbi:hypothetical protein TcasGA2_TC001404 [Tribolium castaneum]|uniref:Uncharacterized protein n=1 Tax=Tribolium castaneum TaxID=7070 RepID=D7EM20_TRICA|nr:hypothetical protein TcasGA2_TC001404 [Tribolium castaneum]
MLSLSAPCEVLSEHCDGIIISISDYNIQKLASNKWLLTISYSTTVTTICPGKNSKNEIIEENKDNDTIVSELLIPNNEFDCCSRLSEKEELPKLQPLQINHLNLDELNTADQKLREFNEELDRSIREPITSRHWGTITYVIIFSISVIIIWLLCKCGVKSKIRNCLNTEDNDDDHRPPSGCCPQVFNYCNVRSTVIRRPSPHSTGCDDSNEEEIRLQVPPTSNSASVRYSRANKCM